MKFLIPIFLASFFVACESEGDGEVIWEESNKPKREYVLFSTTEGSELVERQTGMIEKEWGSSDPVIVSALTSKKAFAYYSNYDPMLYRGVRTEKTTFEQEGIFDKIELLDWSGKTRWSFQVSPSNFSFHGKIFPLANGNILIQGWERVSNEELYQLGRLHEGLPTGGYTILEKVVELRPNLIDGSTKTVWEWNLKNQLIQDKYLQDSNYVANPLLSLSLDINHHTIESGVDWAGTEAMAFNENRNHIAFYFKKFNAFSIIDRESKKFIFKQEVSHDILAMNWENDLIGLFRKAQTDVTIENINTTFTAGKYIEDSLKREKELTVRNMPEEAKFDFDVDKDKSFMIVDEFYDKSWKVEYNQIDYQTWSWQKVWELRNNSEINDAKLYWSDEVGL
jgi:hypothetical protein